MKTISSPSFAACAAKPLNILLADDEAAFRGVLRHCLERLGHEVVCAANGREVSEALKQNHFDLVITDVVMPDGDGLEVIIQVKKTEPATRVIAMSGGGSYLRSTDCLRLARTLGAQEVLSKPFNPQQLVEAVEHATMSHAVVAA